MRAVSRNGLPAQGAAVCSGSGVGRGGLQREEVLHEAPDPAPTLAVGLRLLQGRRLLPEPAAFACRPRPSRHQGG